VKGAVRSAPARSASLLLAENVQRIADLEAELLMRRSWGERLGDRLVAIAGSPASMLAHAVAFAGWILTNTGMVPGVEIFDPYPFAFLTLVVSLEAIFLSLAVLNNQSRMAFYADRRAHLDLQINLLAEAESTATLRLLQQVARSLGVRGDAEHDSAATLAATTDILDLAKELESRLPPPA
jgi:uncharacterized membrane protein